MMFDLNAFPDVVVGDTEFSTVPEGDIQKPLCVCAKGVCSGRVVRYWVQGEEHKAPPPFFLSKPDILFVAFRAEAELRTFLAMGWPAPRFVLDVYYLHRRMTNGWPCKRSLAGSAQTHNLPLPYTADNKHTMQQRAAIGGHFDFNEQVALMDYCIQDVEVTLDLFRVLCPDHPALWTEALFYGEYLKVVAKEEHRGLPVNKHRLERLLSALPAMIAYLVKTIPLETRFYDEAGHFSETALTEYILHHDLAWLPANPAKKRKNSFDPPPTGKTPRLKPATDASSLETLVKIYPQFRPLADVRYFLERMQVQFLPVGHDGRCRTPLWPATSDTLRNQASSTKYLWHQPRWARNFLKPPPGYSVIEVDISQEEFYLAGILSADQDMIADYNSGDAYLACAIRMGLAPSGATETTHKSARSIAKTVILGTLYGLTSVGLAQQLNVAPVYAEYYLQQLKFRYPTFFKWVDGVVAQAAIEGIVVNHYGWVRGNTRDINPRSLRNFPIQSAGSSLLHRVCVFADRAGVPLIGTVHDSFLAETPAHQAKEAADLLQEIIRDVTYKTLGHRFRTGSLKIISYPNSYRENHHMWDRVQEVYQAVTGETL